MMKYSVTREYCRIQDFAENVKFERSLPVIMMVY